MKRLTVVFQGDSITDAGRDKRNYHDMGKGYPKYASDFLKNEMPDAEFEFINLGIGGNRTDQLFDRLYKDAIALNPDVISVLIGINDGAERVATTDEQIAVNYRAILTRLKAETHAKIVMMAPYLLDCEDKEEMRRDLARLLPVIRGLAEEFADVYIPLDRLFEEALKVRSEPCYYSADGVHPNANGAEFIGKCYADAVKPLLKQI